MAKKVYQIALHGCDDSTYFDMELTKKELELVKKISELSKQHSEYGCMPILEVREKEAEE